MNFVILFYILVFVVAKNVILAQNAVTFVADLPGSQNFTEIPGMDNATNIVEDPVLEMQLLNNTIDTIVAINAPNATTLGVTVQNVTNSSFVEIEPKNTTEIIHVEVPESQTNTNLVASTVPERNITNSTITPIKTVSSSTEVLGITPVSIPGEQEISVVKSFMKNGIVPDVIPVAPKYLLNVVFSGGRNVTLGNKLAPSHVKDIPKVMWKSNPYHTYTLIAVDPDLPSRKMPLLRSFLHWCVVNIPGDEVDSGYTLAEYIGAGPSKNSGVHRLVFLLYRQPEFIEMFDEIKLSNATSYGRGGFSVTDFALKYNLGDPVAGNFYKSFYDDYVPVLYKLLGISKGNALAPGKMAIVTVVCIFVYFYL